MEIWSIFIRLTLAIIIGGAIGYERETKNRPAGFRTHILVCIGATLVSLMQVAMIDDAIANVTANPYLAEVLKVDYGRIGAQVITGVGFLGAGTILHTKNSIKGLTTAASLWVVACLGLAIGMGYYVISIMGALYIEITLGFLKKFQNRFMTNSKLQKIEIHYINKKESINFIEKILDEEGIKIVSIEFINFEDTIIDLEGREEWCSIYTIKIPYMCDINEMLSKLSFNENIVKIGKF